MIWLGIIYVSGAAAAYVALVRHALRRKHQEPYDRLPVIGYIGLAGLTLIWPFIAVLGLSIVLLGEAVERAGRR